MLHIGLHKTGTTTIQNVLCENRDSLLEQEGVLYPSPAPNSSTPLRPVFGETPGQQINDKIAGRTTEQIAARQKNFLDSLDAEISSSDWNTLLMSSEGVSKSTLSEMSKLREWGETYSSRWTVLICVRHPVGWSRSVAQQVLKQGSHTLEQLYQMPSIPNYRSKISTAISVFGLENIRVFDFDAAVRSDGGIVGEFARQAGLSPASRELLVSRAIHHNESLSMEAIRILDSLNQQRPMIVDGVKAPRRAGPGRERGYISRIKGQKFDLPAFVKENIRLRSQNDVAWLNDTFGLDLYRDVVEPTPRSEVHGEAAASLSDSAVDSIADLFGELVTDLVFYRILNQGRSAVERGDFQRAGELFEKAAQLDPDAPQPKKLLKKLGLG